MEVRNEPGKILRQHDIVNQIQRWHELEGLVNNPKISAAPKGHLVFSHIVDRDA